MELHQCFSHWLVLSVLILIISSITSAMHLSNETDRASLLAWKAGIKISTSYDILSTWNDSSHFCQWHGITCSRRHRRVIALDLPKYGLMGTLSPHIGNLSFLRRIELQENKLHGDLPQELGRLTRLQVLNISHNSLEGMVPANLSHCSKLKRIVLNNNQLGGEFPVELTTLPNLIDLWLTWNQFTSGAILPSLVNLSSLEYLSFGGNSLIGSIPYELGRLQRLKILTLASNFLSGTIPSSIYNLSSLSTLSLSVNQLEGSLPPNIELLLPDLQELLLAGNKFTGPIPDTLSNISSLINIYLSANSFSGRIPANLGKLQGLQALQLSYNQLLEDDDRLNSIASLTNCTELGLLGILGNLLDARLPESISNLSTRLRWLALGENNIYGKIPTGIGNLVGLEFLVFELNSLTGEIPPSIWSLPRLVKLSLSGNKLSGKLPFSFCNNSHLVSLALGGNKLEGHIPTSIGQCDKLQTLGLEENKFGGTMPKEIFTIPSLSIYLGFSFNFLSGPIPSEIGNMRTLSILMANHNNFSSEIPSSLGSCQSLRKLYLGNNAFEGVIPSSLKMLRGIEELDLSHNNLSGPIPSYIENFKHIHFLNLSFNNLEGEVPKGGVFLNSSAVSLSGNNGICGGPPNLKLSDCPVKKAGKKRGSTHLDVVIPVVGSAVVVLVVIAIMVLVCWKRRPKARLSSADTSEGKYWKVSYKDIQKATKGFSTECLIGSGKYGSVYKATFEDGKTVAAVKVLNLQVRGSSSTFAVEIKTLRKIRHRNLVKILTVCESVDYQGNDFKALVLQYMGNGSLQEWLHNNIEEINQVQSLNIFRRLNMAIDVATALDYLQNQYDRPIVHCDIKPSNILLDDEMVAHVADFGLAKILDESSRSFSHDESSSALVKGTIGYVPPEYGMGGEVSTQRDVYSYGILLLEMFTGKSPTNEMFNNGLSLHTYVVEATQMSILEVLDRQLLLEDEGRTQEEIIDCIGSVLRVGVSCSMVSPQERPRIKDVVKKMNGIWNTFIMH